MVDNRGISPLSATHFKADNSSANKMSEEKMGQGGEYFAQEMQDEENQNTRNEVFQDRSAQLRASLNGLAMANAGSMMVIKSLKEKEKEKEKTSAKITNKENKEQQQEEATSQE